MSRIRVLLCAFAALALLAGVQLLPSLASAQGSNASERVIVLFKQQSPALPATTQLEAARAAQFQTAQAGIRSQLAVSGARNVQGYSILDAISATVPAGEAAALRSDPAVSEVVPDQVIQLASPQVAGSSVSASAPGSAPPAGACAPRGKVQLNPQALQTMHVASDARGVPTARSLGATGAGVKVAFIADGLDINNPDFIRRNGQHVFVDYKDFSGQGTGVATGGGEAFLDASSVAAQGRKVYDVSHYSDLPLNRPCRIRVEGVAPGARLVGLSIFGAENAGFGSQFLHAIDYAVTHDHVNVLNESLGSNYYPDDGPTLDLIKRADDAAVAAGTTVTVSSGDAGVTSTIGAPSTDPKVLSVGASTTYRINAQTGYGGARFPGVSRWLNNNISSFSSGGFDQAGRTVDLVAPGEDNWALCSTNVAMYSDCTGFAGQPFPVQQTGGTSESAPLIAGEAALVIQAYRGAHHGATPSPALVKQLIVSNTDDIGAPADQQGSGLGDAYRAVLAAKAYRAKARGTAAQRSGALVASRTQLNVVAGPASGQTLTDRITNESAASEKLSVSTRKLGPYTNLREATVNLSETGSPVSPQTTDWQGKTVNFERVHFTVPRGESRLSASIAFQNASPTDLAARVRLTLITPDGALAGYSVPQGDGNYGNLQIANPTAGVWSAYIYSRITADGGTTGPVTFGAEAARYESFGSVTPSRLSLAPGASGNLTLHVRSRSAPGDSAGAIVVSSRSGARAPSARTTIPVTLRSLISTGPRSFTDVLTGGNGRALNTGQTFYYQLRLPRRQAELNATAALADNPDNPFSAWLISPSGEAQAFASNTIPDANGNPQHVAGAALHVLGAAAGTWTLIVTFAPQVSGNALNEPFRVSTSEAALGASRGGLPDSLRARLTAGTSYVYNVKIRNRGPAPEAFFPDARLFSHVPLALAPLGGSDVTEPLALGAPIPGYLVPSETTVLHETAQTGGSQPVQFDTNSPAGDPDVASTVGRSASVTLRANPVTPGVWGVFPVNVGAYRRTGAPPENVSTSASVVTRAFDRRISSPAGDLWPASADPSTINSFNPVVVGPGQTATIPIGVTPTGASGTHVRGTLFIDDANFFLFDAIEQPNGDEVAAIPYSYTVR